jgi:transcriptional regulator with GAF, ATPase, and Fis domain
MFFASKKIKPIIQTESSFNKMDSSNAKVSQLVNLLNPSLGIKDYTAKFLSLIAREKEILQAVFLLVCRESSEPTLRFLSGYACMNMDEANEERFLMGEGLPGQVAMDRQLMNLKSVPDGYLKIKTGLGEAKANSLLIFPVEYDDKLIGVIELASFHEFTHEDENYFLTLSRTIAPKLMDMVQMETLNN